MSRTRIVFLPDAPDEAPLQLLLGPGGGVIERGVLPVLNEAEVATARCVLIVPGEAVTVRWLNLPTRNDQQARAAAALALEDILAAPVAGAHLALGALEADGQRPVAVVDPETLRGWLAIAARHGLQPEAAIPDCLALPEPGEGEPLNAAAFAGRLAVRGRRTAFSAETDLAPLLLKDREVRDLAPDEIERALAEAAARPTVDLLQGPFDPARALRPAWRDMRRAAILAAVALVSPLLLMAAQVAREEMAVREIRQRTEAHVAAVLPAGQAVENPLAQAEARLAQVRVAAGAGPAALAAQLFTAMEALDQAQVESLIAMPDGSMRASVSYVNYSDIDTLTTAMRRVGVTLRQEGAREEGGRVIGDIILGARS